MKQNIKDRTRLIRIFFQNEISVLIVRLLILYVLLSITQSSFTFIIKVL